jgi:hypothetical protein
LVREKGVVLVFKKRAELYRSCGRIDLVVERQQLSGSNFGLLRAIEYIDGQRGSLAYLRLYLTQAILRDRKNDVIGCICVMTTRADVVALAWFACTTLPGSSRRSPTRPEIGAMMWQ